MNKIVNSPTTATSHPTRRAPPIRPGPGQLAMQDGPSSCLRSACRAGDAVTRSLSSSRTTVVRWRLRDLAWWVFEEFAISLDETTVGGELRRLGYRKLSARPQHHAQDEGAAKVFEKASLPASRRSPPRCRPAPP